jgi:hypothetical protein
MHVLFGRQRLCLTSSRPFVRPICSTNAIKSVNARYGRDLA